jgi:S-DNA-T family DNA segregation ATPase FtsK/SpoIIIE
MRKRRGTSTVFWESRRLIWRFGFLLLILVILYLSAEAIFPFTGALLANLVRTFGAGTAIFFVAAGVLLWALWRQTLLSMLGQIARSLRYWNQWLAAIAFGLAGFGILAFIEVGGTLGERVIATPNVWGTLRLAALVFLGVLFLAPRRTLRLLGQTARFSLIILVSILRFLWGAARFSATALGSTLRFLRGAAVGLGSLLGDGARRLDRGILGMAHLFRQAGRWVSARRRPTPPVEEMPPPPREETAPAPPGMVETPPPRAHPPAREATPPPAPPPKVEEKPQVAWEKPTEALPLITAAGWQMPVMDMLEHPPEVEFAHLDNEKRARLIEDALKSYGVEAQVVQINVGPTVTQFGIEPGWDRKYKEAKVRDEDGNIRLEKREISKTRVKVDRITSLANDLALALSAPSIRIEAPVPGKPVVGIEVPNSIAGLVTLRGVMESPGFQRLKGRTKLALALGKGAGGEAVVADLTRMPHLLIAGSTGSGKTVCLNAITCCLLMNNTPDEVRFVMIDPKRVELVTYNSVPHLINPVITDSDRAVETLRWLNREMDRRFQKLATVGARNIQDYNKVHRPGGALPYLVLVIDELADLMMTAPDEVERTLARLAQLARATGIHLVVATQRPSVDVVTGLIKANFPCRISFAVTALVDSRTILDMAGAEKLLGRGDMLYLPTDAAKPKRLQGCFVSDAELERLVSFWALQRRPGTAPTPLEEAQPSEEEAPADPLLEAARRLLQEHKQVSASFLARRLQIGHHRAEQLMDLLEPEEDSEAEEPEDENSQAEEPEKSE